MVQKCVLWYHCDLHFWTTKSNQGILESKWTFVLNLKKFPPKYSWNITFTWIGRTIWKRNASSHSCQCRRITTFTFPISKALIIYRKGNKSTLTVHISQDRQMSVNDSRGGQLAQSEKQERQVEYWETARWWSWYLLHFKIIYCILMCDSSPNSHHLKFILFSLDSQSRN